MSFRLLAREVEGLSRANSSAYGIFEPLVMLADALAFEYDSEPR
jgi:hypothetical protein